MGSNSPAATILESSSVPEKEDQPTSVTLIHTTDFGFLPIPKRLRYNPEKPFHFGIVLNIAFGIASTFSELYGGIST